jgi:hypothetical protein
VNSATATAAAPTPILPASQVMPRPNGANVHRYNHPKPTRSPVASRLTPPRIPATAQAIACPTGVSAYRYTHTAGTTSSRYPSRPSPWASGTTA